ncbi:hypothetical protein RCK03_25060, partial [Salmonella enterica subsp. enterica serovar 1,4,[5],12:i:-]
MKSLTLFNIEHQTLQILTLGMIDVDGMVGRLMQLVKDAHLATCLSGSGEDGITEMILCYHLRTTEGKEDSAWLNLLESLVVQ